jgi:hypothetical protein
MRQIMPDAHTPVRGSRPERGVSIANHSQSQRVKKHALATIRGIKLRPLREYVRLRSGD